MGNPPPLKALRQKHESLQFGARHGEHHHVRVYHEMAHCLIEFLYRHVAMCVKRKLTVGRLVDRLGQLGVYAARRNESRVSSI